MRLGRDFMTMEGRAFVVLPPRHVATDVAEYQVSSDGAYLAVVRQGARSEPRHYTSDSPFYQGEGAVQLLDRRTLRQLATQAIPAGSRLTSLRFLPNSPVLVASLMQDIDKDQQRATLLRLTPTGPQQGLVHTLGKVAGGNFIWIVGQYGFYRLNSHDGQGLVRKQWLIAADGQMREIPGELEAQTTATGGVVLFDPSDPSNRQTLDPASLELVPSRDLPLNHSDRRPPVVRPALYLHRVPLVEGGTSEPIEAVWLSTRTAPPHTPGVPDPSVALDLGECLIAADASRATLTVNLDAVFYIAHGSLFMREIRPFPLEELEKLADAIDQRETLNRARQLATAIHLFSADNQDMLPSGEDIRKQLMPYLKNAQMFDGFTYTHSGGHLAEIPDPSKHEVGHVVGRRGWAVIYADGSSRWRSGR
jgi:hypothetical protein